MSQLDDVDEQRRPEHIRNLTARREVTDLGFVMSSAEGRRFIKFVLDLTGLRKLSYSGPGKAEDTFFYEGQRNIGNKLDAMLEEFYGPERLLMMQEAKLLEKQSQ